PIKYAQALAQTLEGDVNPQAIIKNLLLLLQRKKQFRLLPKILLAFEQEWAKRRGVVKMDVTYPEKFEASLMELETNLSTKLGKKIDMRAKPSKTILGGFRVRVEDTLIDASLEGRLKALERRLNN
ncbi:F0F1 ATP synthase subunit delta, partial [Candidatus Peregrinibacteria bacterium]|nr:F0F1 ATP synthase subunit delta [Candidatus Peregrinibacteria bacterium]